MSGQYDDCGCKVGRVADRYDLAGIDEELANRWLGVGDERRSLRDLETHFNRSVLRAAMREQNMDVLDGEVENLYRLLRSDDTSAGVRTQTRRRLTRGGVDVEQLQSDFVSHQTVYTHLTDCLGVSREDEDDDADPVEDARATVFALQNRTVTVTDEIVQRLRANGDVDVGEFDVFVDVSVTCNDCGQHVGVGTLLDRGHCDCRS